MHKELMSDNLYPDTDTNLADQEAVTTDALAEELQPAHVATSLEALPDDDAQADYDEIDDDVDDDEAVGSKYVRYNRAFVAKLSQAPDHLKAYYNVLKNHLLSYKGVKSRISWCNDSYNRGRDRLAKINVRGGGLIVYLALDPKAYEGTKYRYRDVGYKKKYADMPMQIKIRSKRGLRYALELTADLMSGLGIAQGAVQQIEYAPAYEELDALIARNLVRVVKSHVGQADVLAPREVLAARLKPQDVPTDDTAVDTAPAVGEVAEEAAPVEDTSPVADEVAADVIAETTPVAAEVEDEAAADTIAEEPPVVAEVDSVAADERLSDKQAEAMVEVATMPVRSGKHGNKKAMVNIDVISRVYRSGDVVDLDSLRQHKLVPAGCGWVKICARGRLDKPLTVKANDFSVIAIKMIVLTGGHAVRVK